MGQAETLGIPVKSPKLYIGEILVCIEATLCQLSLHMANGEAGMLPKQPSRG